MDVNKRGNRSHKFRWRFFFPIGDHCLVNEFEGVKTAGGGPVGGLRANDHKSTGIFLTRVLQDRVLGQSYPGCTFSVNIEALVYALLIVNVSHLEMAYIL